MEAAAGSSSNGDAAAAAGKKDGEAEKKVDPKLPAGKMFRYADGTDVALMAVGTLAAIANGVSQPLMTYIFGEVVDAFGGAADPEATLRNVTKVVLYFIYLGIGTAAVSFLQVACWTITGERQATRIRAKYLQAVLRQDIAFFDKEMTTGQVVARMSGDTVLFQDAIGEKVGKFVQLVATFVGGFVIAFARGWLLTLVMMAAIPPVVVAGGAVSQVLAKISSRGQASYSEAADVVEQTLGAIRTVASFNGEKRAIAMYDSRIKKAYRAAVEEGTTNGFGMGSVFLIFFASYGLAIWYGGTLIVTKGYTGGTIINILFAVMTGAMSLGSATPSIAAFAEGQAAAYRLFSTIDRVPEIDSYEEGGLVLEDVKGDVELKDVYFSYPTRPEQLIFDGFSLKVPSGSTMAIVGESGSGKSTVISLVERFYDPQAGEVLIDGIDIKRLKLSWIRGKISLVSQEPLLFMTTIKENISYGKEDATVEEIRRAIELANAANFIDKLPEGLDTMVGQRGAQLSGGQKQRVAIARAILKDPKILLLDEATSALDVESERAVQEALNRIMVQRTTIVVAHRLSTVRNAECISVIQQGKIVEQGPHDKLVKNPDGAYSQLIRLQETHQEEGREAWSKNRSSSMAGSIGAGSDISSSRHSFTTPAAATLPVSDAAVADEKEAAEQGSQQAKQKAPVGRLVKLNRPEFLIIVLGCFAAAGHGVLFPMFGLLLANAIQSFYEVGEQLKKDTSFWALLCLIIGIGSIIAIPLNYFLFGIAGGKLIERVRSLSFQSVLRQEIGWFDDPANSSGAIGARLSVDALNVRRLVGDNLALQVQVLCTLITGMVIAFVADWRLSLIIMAVVPLVGLQGYAQVKFLKGFSGDAKMMYEDASQVATDAVGSIRTVASFCAEKRVIRMYDAKCSTSMKQGIRTGYVGGVGFGFSFLVLYLTYALVFWIGAKFVQQGKTTFTDVFKVFFALVLATIGASQTSALASDSTKAKDSAISIFALLDRKSKIDSSSDDGRTLQRVSGDIDFRHISFCYPSRPDVQIFADFSLAIPAGKTIALVGESGSGKSTVIALLERFYDPDSGTILLDGVELKSLNLRWLRDQMGLVSQEPVLFNDTIRANIAYGKEGEATEEEIVAAAKSANAHDFISGLDSGYATTVGERGIQLSGGQKQRVAIARAILKDPRVLLLDEATSALDAESERVVQEALDRVMVGRTTVIVAHRLSTIKNADIIAVLKDGAIVEKGRHETLMGIRGGVYASLVELRSGALA